MHALVVTFRIHTPFIAAFEAATHENARLSRDTEPGCRQFYVCRDPADSALFFLCELYDDEGAVQAHLQSAHFVQMNDTSAPWMASKAVCRYTRTSP